MAQFLVVKYFRRRRVYIDGKRSGFTNTTLRVQKGPHRVTLGEPPNYTPQQRRPNVKNTTVITPKRIEFTYAP